MKNNYPGNIKVSPSGQKAMSKSQPVVLASDQSAIATDATIIGDVPVTIADPIDVNIQGGFTRFNEILSAQRVSQLNLKPTWGISVLRYARTTTGAGASVGETNGEFLLQSGTANNGLATIMTNERGLYYAGSMGQAGIGVRIPTAPLSTAFCEWGYTDFTNGFYFGVDGTGHYVAYVTNSVVTKAYQSAWNVDKLDGTGTSGRTLDLSNGVVCHIDFVWYGYGDIEFSFFVKNPTTLQIERMVCHRFKIDGAASVIDPNQPLSFRSGNGASTTTNVSLYIGGHQFSVIGGDSTPQNRQAAELLRSYTTALNTNWQPLIAIRKTANFNGRTNSLNVKLDSFQVASTGDVEVRITVGGTTSNLSWGTPTGRTASETGVESKVTGGTALTTSVDGEPSSYSYVIANGTGSNTKGTTAGTVEFTLGQATEIILWVRRISGAGSVVINHANLTWTTNW